MVCNHLHFSLTPTPGKDKQLIYHERVPGGYLNIKPADNSESFEPDLEVLFNAINTENELINQAFHTIYQQ